MVLMRKNQEDLFLPKCLFVGDLQVHDQIYILSLLPICDLFPYFHFHDNLLPHSYLYHLFLLSLLSPKFHQIPCFHRLHCMPWKFLSPTPLKSILLPWWTEIVRWLLHHQTSLKNPLKIYSSEFPLYLFIIIRQYNLGLWFIVCCKVSIFKYYWFTHRKLPLRIGKNSHFLNLFQKYNVPKPTYFS